MRGEYGHYNTQHITAAIHTVYILCLLIGYWRFEAAWLVGHGDISRITTLHPLLMIITSHKTYALRSIFS